MGRVDDDAAQRPQKAIRPPDARASLIDKIRLFGRAALRRLRRAGFAVRLFLALGAALVLVGIAAYELISNELAGQQVDNLAAGHRADAEALEEIGGRNLGASELEEVDEFLGAVALRPGVIEALLIDQNNIVRSAAERSAVGERDSDPGIDATLESGLEYSGREADPKADGRDFEFISPVELPSGRYAFESTFGHATFDAQLHDLRRLIILIGLMALVAVTIVFYLLGGRTLLRSHDSALRRATRDGLTDLPNLRAFADELERAVSLATRHHDPLALALVDLDHFKLINDRHGHQQGDAVLKQVAAILAAGRTTDRAYRLGGDEFAMLLPRTDAEGVTTTVHRLSRKLSEAGIRASIGVASMWEGQPPDALRAEADAALYEAKRRGKSGFVRFEEIRDHVVVTTASKREGVSHLIDDRLLTTAYQPIWTFDSGELLGIEALLRPDVSIGLSGPAEAFDVAEKIGRAHELDQVAVENALRAADSLPEGTLLFLNLCPKTLELDSAGDDWFAKTVGRAGLAPERVVVEVTERLGARTPRVVESLQRLRAQGFKIALDDVGTGNAGLEMLRKIDAEFVKLDRSIVAAAAVEPNARAVLTAMASFASETGAFVIAEGIEDQETLDFLRAIQPFEFEPGTIIQGGQGFELGRPSAKLPTGTPQAPAPRGNGSVPAVTA